MPLSFLPRALAIAAIVTVGLRETSSSAAALKAARPRAPASRTGRATPGYGELVKAARKNDRGALERLASRMGAARLGAGARGADAAVAQASLAAIPLARGGVVLAGTVAERLDASDPLVAAAAARALGTLLDGDVPSELADWEVPPDVVARACAGLRALAARASAPEAVRLAAIDAVGMARPTCGGAAELIPVLDDPSPALARAVALVLHLSDAPNAAEALRRYSAAPPVGLHSASIATICRGLDPARVRRRGDMLSQVAVSWAGALVTAPATPPEDAVELLDCLAASGSPGDRALLEKLRAGPPSGLRDRAAQLLGDGSAGKPE